jgi:hypothetical protein
MPALPVNQCHMGYPRLAAFLDSDESFMVYRRFGYIQARLLLEKQDDLQKLEKKLDEYDDSVKQNLPKNLRMRDLKPADAEPRQRILDELEGKFLQYGESGRVHIQIWFVSK